MLKTPSDIEGKKEGGHMIEEERVQKWRVQDGETPDYKAYHEVYVTKDLGSLRNDQIVAFIGKHIAGFKGHTEDKHGIPLMLFERVQDAHSFANELSGKLDIPKEHITVKARKYTR
jgi:hypothetical protein